MSEITLTVEQVVVCKKIRPQVLIKISMCEECEFHKGIIEVMQGQNNLPPVCEVECAHPQRVQIQNLAVKEA